MSFVQRTAVALGLIGLFHPCMAAHAELSPTGTFSLRVPSVETPTEANQAGKGLVKGDRYWLYINFKIIAAILPTSERERDWHRLVIRPMDVPLPPGNISVAIVTYDQFRSFCEMRWDLAVNITAGETTTFVIDRVGEVDAKAVMTTGDGMRTGITVPRDCDNGTRMGHMYIRTVPSREVLVSDRKEFQKEISDYEADAFVQWARDNLRLPLSSRYLKLSKDADPMLGGYELDGFQLRELIERMESRDGLAGFNVPSSASVPTDLREEYQEFESYVTLVKNNQEREIKAFYSIADQIDRVPNPPRQ